MQAGRAALQRQRLHGLLQRWRIAAAAAAHWRSLCHRADALHLRHALRQQRQQVQAWCSWALLKQQRRHIFVRAWQRLQCLALRNACQAWCQVAVQAQQQRQQQRLGQWDAQLQQGRLEMAAVQQHNAALVQDNGALLQRLRGEQEQRAAAEVHQTIAVSIEERDRALSAHPSVLGRIKMCQLKRHRKNKDRARQCIAAADIASPGN